MEEISSEISNKYAILIDSENVSAKYIESIFDELSRLGSITVRKIYGDWSKNNNGWDKDCLLSYSIQPVQQFSYTAGKNSTDSAMIIDAMDLLYTSNIDGFCLVTSDSDFTRLASRLREAGKQVIGIYRWQDYRYHRLQQPEEEHPDHQQVGGRVHADHCGHQ